MKFILFLLSISLAQFCIIIYLGFYFENEKIVIKKEYVPIYETKIIEKEIQYEIFEITAYTAGIESTGKNEDHPLYKITASGTVANEGWTMACPQELEFGTKIYLPKYDRIYICEDRGSAITKGKLDIYMEDLTNALEFGRRFESVLILPSYP